MNNTVSIKDLSALIMVDKNFSALSEKMDVYCPFEALKISNFEIRHSNFLADTLSPNRPHGFGDRILKKFIESILTKICEDSLALNIHLEDLMNAEIRREWNNIDLLIRIPNGYRGNDLVFAIEIKVHALESKKQLEKYTQQVRAEWPAAKHIFIFLTPADSAQPTHPDWEHIFFDTIVESIESFLQEESGAPAARTMLKSYTDMIRRNHMSNPEMEELATKIWEKHQLALEFLIENQPFHIQPIIDALHSDDFLETLNTQLKSQAGKDLSVERINSGKKYINFRVINWSEYNDIEPQIGQPSLIKAEIVISEQRCAVRLMLCPGDQIKRRRIYNVFESADILSKQRKREDISTQWTRLSPKTIRDKTKMQKIVENFYKMSDTERQQIILKLNNDISHELADIIVKADSALIQAKENGEIN